MKYILPRLMFGCLLGALGILSLPADSHAQSPKRVATEKVIGTVDLTKFDPKKRKPTFWISPDGRRAAWLTEKGITIDGQSKEYPYGVNPDSFSFSPDSKRTGYVAIGVGERRNEVVVLDGKEATKGYSSVRPGPVFSPDSQHYACVCRLAASSFANVLVIDGREGMEQNDNFSWELTFTSDSRRVIYAVRVGENYRMREESLDGEARIERQHGPVTLIGNFFYGPAGQVGYFGREGEQQLVFYNGKDDGQRFKEVKPREISLSADGNQIAYIGEPTSFADQAVVNGKPGKAYGGLDGDIIEGSLEISPDGRRYGYSIKNFSKRFVIIDGQPGKIYPNVGGPIFSPDSKRYAYQAANANKKLMMVVDGQEGAAYDDIGLPEFSPDSKQVAYWAEAAGKQFMVVGGQKQKAYDNVGVPHYSPDGKRLLYLAETGDKWLLVDNGKEGKAYEDIDGRIFFGPDGQRVATVFGGGGKEFVVIDGLEGNQYDTIVTDFGGKLHFDAADRLHYHATKGDQLLLVEETIQP